MMQSVTQRRNKTKQTTGIYAFNVIAYSSDPKISEGLDYRRLTYCLTFVGRLTSLKAAKSSSKIGQWQLRGEIIYLQTTLQTFGKSSIIYFVTDIPLSIKLNGRYGQISQVTVANFNIMYM